MFSHNSPHHSAHPLRIPRLISFLFLFAFGIAGMGVGINALIKFNDQKRQLSGAAPAGATVTIDTSDVLDSGYVITVVCGLLALFSVIFALPALSARVGLIRLQAFIFGFLTLWLFATLVAFTDFFANRSAKVSASIGSFPIPDSIIQSIVHSLGASTQYNQVDYLRLTAIIPWFTFLFGLTSTILSLLASRRAAYGTAYPVSSAGVDRQTAEKEKGEKASIEQRDVV